ncbi:hypothetical protein [Alkaliphilus crotonatoxidans]
MEKSKLAMLREGIPNHRIVNYPGTDLKVAVVALSSREIIEAREGAMKYLKNKQVDLNTADLVLNLYILQLAMRNPESLKEPFISSIEELEELSTPLEIYELHQIYLEVQNEMKSDLQMMTTDDFEALKKQLGQMTLKDFDGELLTILKRFHLTLASKASQGGN